MRAAGEAAAAGARGGARGAGGGGGAGGARARGAAVPHVGQARGRLPPAPGAPALADTDTRRARCVRSNFQRFLRRSYSY